MQTKADIIKLDCVLQTALLNNDVDAMNDLLSDDFELYTINQGVFNKVRWINELKSGGMSYQEL